MVEDTDMVYVPWKVAERYMLHKWEEALKENPSLPRPTKCDINIQWFVWLDWVPNNSLDMDRFQQMFPIGDRHHIQYRVLKEFTGQLTKKRSKYEPIAQPLGEEPGFE